MPTQVIDKLISWASDVDPATIRQAEKTARRRHSRTQAKKLFTTADLEEAKGT
jgi:hypothetical protein